MRFPSGSFTKKIEHILFHDHHKQTTKQTSKQFPKRFRIFYGNAPIIDFIDWSKTKAYSMYYAGISINLKGREPAGIVSPEEYDSIRQVIMEKVLQIKAPDGQKVIEKACRVEESIKIPAQVLSPTLY